MLSFTGVDSQDGRIGKANTWLADIGAGFRTDELGVEVAAHFAPP